MVARLAMLHSKHVAPEELALEATRPQEMERMRTAILSLGIIVFSGFIIIGSKSADTGCRMAS